MTPPYLAEAHPRSPLLYARSAAELAPDAGQPALEWLETDGRGGYAASTPDMLPTRRYHGWLVASPAPGSKRHLFVSGCSELLLGEEQPLALGQGAREPEAALVPLARFESAPWPSTTYERGRLVVRRELLLCRSTRAVLVRYRLRGAADGAALELRPWFAFREADALTYANSVLAPGLAREGRGYRFQPYASLPALALSLSAPSAAFSPAPRWRRSGIYIEDARRGYEAEEDQFSPGSFRVELEAETSLVIAFALEHAPADPAALFESEARERERRARSAGATPAGRLTLGAGDFLYRTAAGRLGVQAGFPWFEEWGRDTFVALPGLTLARGRIEECGEVLAGALPYLREGLLPNVFGLTAEASAYDSADAALWYARAVGLYRKAGGAKERLLDEHRPALESIVAAYRTGTALGMRIDEEGLLHAGSRERNATWMDARLPAGPVTPRAGRTVEGNALWYALLSELEGLHRLAGDPAAESAVAAARMAAGKAFLRRFWIAAEGRLLDCFADEGPDPALRPNMVIAAALEASPLSRAERAGIVDLATRELLTPCGLRTLAPGDPAYRGRYEGDVESRDRAYHQGTVWPWLFGFYVEAALRAASDQKLRARELRRLWTELMAELDRAGLHHVSEVFDGDAPQRPSGTFAQAWNTGELLRAHRLLEEAGA